MEDVKYRNSIKITLDSILFCFYEVNDFEKFFLYIYMYKIKESCKATLSHKCNEVNFRLC